MTANRPGGEPAVPPRALATDAGRERLIGVLREHYAQGLLDDDEFSHRVGAVLAARFTDEAAAAVAGLPALSAAAGAAGSETSEGSRPRRGRYAESARPGPGWVPTGERFRDPASGQVMRVWVDPADQARHYVPEPG